MLGENKMILSLESNKAWLAIKAIADGQPLMLLANDALLAMLAVQTQT